MGEPITIHAAKTRFSELVRRAEAGEEIIIARGDKPVAKLVAVQPKAKPKRQFGSLKGVVKFDESFWDPLPDEFLAPFKDEE
ncbi:type II toxin-antitoxin system prevent-host-death family antitoxin [Vineibacter terrae]|uniref:type II toxin-antitoxin system Phd/YefM family antitoxin n=1 Tax=Vineibacter terrae TaxID=2586908 RepID=UPI002E320AB3|nr:type II toxin-antitoxin system prevent-host-death family antitoxin [Vineibacter terrae]HEX2890316.1 type II toxin-antitoxin system prevent-host-death family antitoxin [Vineibacter terrae]